MGEEKIPISKPVLEGVINYLGKRPFVEVVNLLRAIEVQYAEVVNPQPPTKPTEKKPEAKQPKKAS